MIIKLSQKGQPIYTGVTYPTPLSYKKLGIEKLNLQLITFHSEDHKGMTAIYKSMQAKKFLDYYRSRGQVTPLYSGKSGKICTLNRDYQRMHLVGILFWNNASILDNLNMDFKELDSRATEKTLQESMLGYLWGKSMPDRKGILHYLNKKSWEVEIKKGDKIHFHAFGLKEDIASVTLRELMDTLRKDLKEVK